MVKVALSDIQEDQELFINMTKKPTYVAGGGRGEIFTLEHKTKISRPLMRHMHSEATKKIGDSNREATRHTKKKVKILEFWER
jgi:hypothetical protein